MAEFADREDALIIDKIVARAVDLGFMHEPLDLHMDISACHANGCPLDLEKLRTADDYNFAHDVLGISSNISRTTGKLSNCFLPRCSK